MWVCVASSHPYLTKQVRNLLRWPTTEVEKHHARREREKVRCCKCGLQFQAVGGDDRSLSCRYHRNRFNPERPLKLIPNWEPPREPPAAAGAPGHLPAAAAPVPNPEPLEIPSVFTYTQGRRHGRQLTYMDWHAHVETLWVGHGWTDKEKNRVVWSCCGAQGFWSQGCDDCDEQHEREGGGPDEGLPPTAASRSAAWTAPPPTDGRGDPAQRGTATARSASSPLRPPAGSSPVSGLTHTVTTSSLLGPGPPAPSAERVAQLTGMGYPEVRAREACFRRPASHAEAVEYLLVNSDKDDDFWAPRFPVGNTARAASARQSAGTPHRAAHGPAPEPEPELALTPLEPLPQ